MKYTLKMILKRRTLSIKGMTCESCESRIEKRLSRIEGVKRVRAKYDSSKVHIDFDPQITTRRRIVDVLDKLGYGVVVTPKKIQGSKNKEDDNIDFSSLLTIGIIVYFGYQTLQRFGIDFIPQVDQNMGYGILFVAGLLTSLHCIAMCGGINLSQCMTYKFPKKEESFSKFFPSFLYNLGRVISYTIVGGIAGGIGSVISFSGAAKGLVALIAGIMMVIIGLNMLNVFPALRRFQPRMPKVLSQLSGVDGKRGPFIVGLFNGLMPCGPLQATQIYALGTGSVIVGAASMFFFSLGTVPLMFGLGAISSFLSNKFTRKMMKISAVLVIVLGIIMFNTGLGLSGVSIFAGGPSTTAIIKGNIQTVTTNLQSGRYTPITVQKGIPVKWTIIVDREDLNGCNNPMIIPKYGFEKKLVPGDNVIEFIPEKEGNIVYTCWMGMIQSNITVVEDISKIPNS